MSRLSSFVILAMCVVSVSGKAANLVFKDCKDKDVQMFTESWKLLVGTGGSNMPLEDAIQKYPQSRDITSLFLGTDDTAVKKVLTTTVDYVKTRRDILVRCEYDQPLASKDEAKDAYLMDLLPADADAIGAAKDTTKKAKKPNWFIRLFRTKHKKNKDTKPKHQEKEKEKDLDPFEADPFEGAPVFAMSVRCRNPKNIMSVFVPRNPPTAADDNRDIVVCPHYWRAIDRRRSRLSSLTVQDGQAAAKPAFDATELDRTLLFDTAGSFLHELTHLAAATDDLAYGSVEIGDLDVASKPKNADGYYFWWRNLAFPPPQ